MSKRSVRKVRHVAPAPSFAELVSNGRRGLPSQDALRLQRRANSVKVVEIEVDEPVETEHVHGENCDHNH